MSDINFQLYDPSAYDKPIENSLMQKRSKLDLLGKEEALRDSMLSTRAKEVELERLESERDQMLDVQKKLAASGNNPDLNVHFDSMIKSGNPKYIELGIRGKEKLAEQDQYSRARDMLIPVGKNVFDRESRRFIMPPNQPGVSMGSGVAAGPTQPQVKLKADQMYDPETQTARIIPGTETYYKAARDYDKSKGGVMAIKNASDNVNKLIDGMLQNDSGLKNNFGGYQAYATRYLPGSTATFRNDLKILSSSLKTYGLKLMRDLAGSSIGAITEKEWPILEGMIASLNSEIPVKDAKRILESVKERFSKLKDEVELRHSDMWAGSPFIEKSDWVIKRNPEKRLRIRVSPDGKQWEQLKWVD